MHEVLVNRLGGLSLPRKSVVRLTDRPDMTLDVYRGRKTTTQQQQQLSPVLLFQYSAKLDQWVKWLALPTLDHKDHGLACPTEDKILSKLTFKAPSKIAADNTFHTFYFFTFIFQRK